MKYKMSIVTSNMALSRLLKSSRIHKPIVYALVLGMGLSVNISSADRFDPPSLKLQLQEFDSRIESSIFNVDFLLSHVLNNGRKTVREVGEITGTFEDILQNTTVFTNNTGVNGAAAGSVIIPPGTSADTIIILNQNEGDSIAIQR